MVNEPEREERKVDLLGLSKLITKNRVVYIVCFLALMGCLYTLYNIGDYLEKCNTHWEEQLRSKGCVCKIGGVPSFNDSFKLQVPGMDTDEKSNDQVPHLIVPNTSIEDIKWD